ncbi:MAG: winged-helix domain-containing protein [Clostridia bacterium]|nr:winged-helix domain-containing protein [Clostridia bacterium]
MMNGIRILSLNRDAVFSRMLAYELRRAGHSIAAPGEPADCCLLDLDAGLSAVPGLPVIGYSRTLQAEDAPFCTCVLPRPFPIDALLDALSALMLEDENPTPQNRIRRDDSSRMLWLGTARLGLMPAEYALFCRLFDANGEPVSRAALIDALPSGNTPGSNLLEVTVCTLRRKLEDSFGIRPIRTVRGIGYRYCE